jgi:hypothetical protein
MSATAGPVARRLRWYWQLEAANAVIVPLFAVGLVLWAGGEPTIALFAAAIACSTLLVIGALYWRAVLRQLERASGSFDYWLPRLAAVEHVSLLLVFAASITVALEFVLLEGGWTAARLAAASLTALAALEYVNYYMVQLQHFDNWSDFKRLMTGRGFRKAHMARDIAAWRLRARGRDFVD